VTMLTAPLIAGHAKDPQLYETLKQMQAAVNSTKNLGASTGVLPVKRGGTGTAVGSITGPGSLAYAAGGTGGDVCLIPGSAGGVGIGTLDPALFRLQVVGDAGPDVNFRYDLGADLTRWRTLWANELQVQTLVAQEVLATIGGRILVGPTTKLTADLDLTATTISVEHNEATSGDILYLQTAPGGIQQVEFLRVTSAYSGSGPYTYTVARAIDGTSANSWLAGDAVFNTGAIGDGFIDIYSQHGVKAVGEAGPTIVGNVRASTTFDGWAPRWAIGNLKGLYGYPGLEASPSVYGAAFGDNAAAWVKIDPTNGVRIGHGTSAPKVWVKADGSAVFTGEVTIVEGSALATALENAQDDATQALADAATANAKIGDMASDSLLVPTEKKQLIREVGDIRNEEPGIYALALTVRNTTERAAYLAAFNALEAYLLTLTGPPTTYSAWDDLSKNTTIVADTFKTKFATYYTKRQLLLDANAALAAKDAADANVVAVAAAKTANWESIVGGSEGAPNVKLALPATTKGLCLNANYMGFYDTLGYPAAPWRTYMDSDGKFYLTGASGTGNKLAWDGTTLAIKGQITVVAGGDGNAATTTEVAAAQAAADVAHGLADAAQADATAAKTLISDMSLDSILSPVEKPALIREVAEITGEYAGIYGLALSIRNATPRTNYGTAYTNLTNYLATLTYTVAWNVTTGNTDVNGGTFRAQFNSYYNKRQLLLDANTALAAADAATAQTTANNSALTANWSSITGGPGKVTVLPANSKGLCLNADYMGFYDTIGYPSTPWRTYMDKDGKFYLSGTGAHGLTWDGGTLAITGNLSVGSVTVDGDGCCITAGAAASRGQSYGFRYGTTFYGGAWGYYGTGGTYPTYYLGIGNLTPVVGCNATTQVSARAVQMGQVLLLAQSGYVLGNPELLATLDLVAATGGGWADFTGVGLFVKDKGLKVGYDHTSGIPAVGTITASGAVAGASFSVSSNQVVGARQSAMDNAKDWWVAGEVGNATDIAGALNHLGGKINELLGKLRSTAGHGLIAA